MKHSTQDLIIVSAVGMDDDPVKALPVLKHDLVHFFFFCNRNGFIEALMGLCTIHSTMICSYRQIDDLAIMDLRGVDDVRIRMKHFIQDLNIVSAVGMDDDPVKALPVLKHDPVHFFIFCSRNSLIEALRVFYAEFGFDIFLG